MSTHKHQCGLTRRGYMPEEGCGHIWEHPDPDGTETAEIYADRHTCPACGQEDQYLKLEVLEELKRLTKAEPILEILARIALRMYEEERQSGIQRLSKQRR